MMGRKKLLKVIGDESSKEENITGHQKIKLYRGNGFWTVLNVDKQEEAEDSDMTR